MGDVLHIAVNVIFVAVIYAMVAYWGLAPLAVVLVLLSKWRVFAVQPRFWFPNIKANLVDAIVGISTIVIAYQVKHDWLAIVWLVLYLGWLLFLKPQSQEFWVGMQALWAQFLGMVALFMVASVVNQPFVVCLGVWLVTWSAARHFLSNYEEPHYRSLSLIWAFIVTQLVWVTLHWTQYYLIFDMKIVLVAVIIGISSASLGGVYHAYKTNTLQKGVLLENGLFAGALLAVILATAHWTTRL